MYKTYESKKNTIKKTEKKKKIYIYIYIYKTKRTTLGRNLIK